MELIKRRVTSGFRVCFFNNCIDINWYQLVLTVTLAYASLHKCDHIHYKNLQYNFPKMRGGVKGRLEFFQKFTRFGSGILPEGQESRGGTSIIQCLPRPCKSFAALHRSSGFFSVAMFSQTFIKGTRKGSPAIEAFALIKLWVTSATKITDFFGSKKGTSELGLPFSQLLYNPFLGMIFLCSSIKVRQWMIWKQQQHYD